MCAVIAAAQGGPCGGDAEPSLSIDPGRGQEHSQGICPAAPSHSVHARAWNEATRTPQSSLDRTAARHECVHRQLHGLDAALGARGKEEGHGMPLGSAPGASTQRCRWALSAKAQFPHLQTRTTPLSYQKSSWKQRGAGILPRPGTY